MCPSARLPMRARLKGLVKLHVWDATEVSDAGVAHLVNLDTLQTNHISNSSLTNASLKHLSKLPALEYMSLQGNRFSDVGLAYLTESPNLKRLHFGLGKTDITDEGVAHLKGLKNLEVFDVQNTRVTVEGLEQLRGLPKLREIWLSVTGITEEGMDRLKAAMPNLKIVR
jgi:hypothetical protein